MKHKLAVSIPTIEEGFQAWLGITTWPVFLPSFCLKQSNLEAHLILLSQKSTIKINDLIQDYFIGQYNRITWGSRQIYFYADKIYNKRTFTNDVHTWFLRLLWAFRRTPSNVFTMDVVCAWPLEEVFVFDGLDGIVGKRNESMFVI